MLVKKKRTLPPSMLLRAGAPDLVVFGDLATKAVVVVLTVVDGWAFMKIPVCICKKRSGGFSVFVLFFCWGFNPGALCT